MSRKGAKTQRDTHCFTLTRWVNACLSASASSLRLCAFARHPISGFRVKGIGPLAFILRNRLHSSAGRFPLAFRRNFPASPARVPALRHFACIFCRLALRRERMVMRSPKMAVSSSKGNQNQRQTPSTGQATRAIAPDMPPRNGMTEVEMLRRTTRMTQLICPMRVSRDSMPSRRAIHQRMASHADIVRGTVPKI